MPDQGPLSAPLTPNRGQQRLYADTGLLPISQTRILHQPVRLSLIPRDVILGIHIMTDYHDPWKQTNHLRQALSQDKLPIGLLLGAGCPAAIKKETESGYIPLIPAIREMTDHVAKKLTASPQTAKPFNAISSYLTSTRVREYTVEDLLGHVRTLKEVGGTNDVTVDNLTQIETVICKTISVLSNQQLPTTDTPYHHVADWISMTPRKKPVELFTTNYDLLAEEALEERRVPFFDGFVGSRRPFFDAYSLEEDELPPRWARLWKLHGSINWMTEVSGTVSKTHEGQNENPSLIHPSHLKYAESRRMPYIAMVDRLRAFLKQPSVVLCTCGYSFSDQHLNDTILQCLQGNPTAVVFAFLYGSLDQYQGPIELATNRSNFLLLAEDAGIIGTKKAPWSRPDASESNSEVSAIEIRETAGTKSWELKLGDFVRYGHFLRDIAANGRR